MSPARPILNRVHAPIGGPQQPVNLARRDQLLTDVRDPPGGRSSRARTHLTLDRGTRTSVARHASLACGAGRTRPSPTTSRGDGGDLLPKLGEVVAHLGHLASIWGPQNRGRPVHPIFGDSLRRISCRRRSTEWGGESAAAAYPRLRRRWGLGEGLWSFAASPGGRPC
jgi:hypothetical protein